MRLAAYGPGDDSPAHRQSAATRSSGAGRWRMRTGPAVRVGIAVLLFAVLIGVGGLFTGAWGPQGETGAAASERPEMPAPLASVQPSAEPSNEDTGQVYVHVAGEVAQPGLIRVDDDARVATAIEEAGGASEEADLSRVNLAAEVTDGEQIYIPGEGEENSQGGPAESGAAPDPADATVDVNAADADQLETLPGIGPARAADLIDWREEHGRFETIEGLLKVPGIGPATLERLRERIRV